MKRTAIDSYIMKSMRFCAILVMALAFLTVFACRPGTVFAEESDITSISFDPADPTLHEDVDGRLFYDDYEWDEEKEEYVGIKEYFQYDCFAVVYAEGSVLNITRDSGTKAYTFDYDKNGFVSEDGELIDRRDIVVNYEQSYEDQWKPGEERSFTVTYQDATCTVNVTIAANPIESISFTPTNEPKLFENISGYWDSYLGNYDPATGQFVGGFDYFTYVMPEIGLGDQLTVSYNDGREPSVYTLREYAEEGMLTTQVFADDSGNMISPYEINFETDQDYDNLWGPGEHTYDIVFRGRKTSVSVEIVPAEITEINFVRKGTPIVAYTGFGYEAKTQAGEQYFCYYHPEFELGDVLEVTFNGIRTETYKYQWTSLNDNYYTSFLDSRGADIETQFGKVILDGRQGEKHWASGADNRLYISVGGAETSVPVEVLENPVISAVLNMDHEVTIKPEKAVTRIGEDGLPFSYYPIEEWNGTGSIFDEGDTITAILATGETAVYTFTLDGRYDIGFYDKDGNEMPFWYFRVTSDQYSNHWKRGGSNQIYISYLGHETGPVSAVLEFFDISKANIYLEKNSYTYNGSPIKPKATVDDDYEEKLLTEGVDYTISYHNNINVDHTGDGAWVQIEGIGKYYGTKKLYFSIEPIKATEKQIIADPVTVTYNGKERKPAVKSVKVKGVTLGKGDYDVDFYGLELRNPGEYGVVIKLKGNYSGQGYGDYFIIPAGTSISKLKAEKKAFTATWKKQTKQTTGYQIQYSLYKNFKGAKKVTVTSNKTASRKISKLKSKKTYYVRVRTYKKSGKKKIYSTWSKAKTVKTK